MEVPTRLTVQPSGAYAIMCTLSRLLLSSLCFFLFFSSSYNIVVSPVIVGEMRFYQLDALNWLIKLYEGGINGILADEMVCVCFRAVGVVQC